MQTHRRHDAYRVERLDEDAIPVRELQVPVHPSIVNAESGVAGVDEDAVWSALLLQQQDMITDGTRVAYLGRLIEDGDAVVVGFSDSTVYLRVAEDVWEQEKNWMECEDAVKDVVQDVHTEEVDSVRRKGGECSDIRLTERGGNVDREAHPFGFVVTVDFPLATFEQHPDVDIDPYPVAERAEFLRFEVGMKGQLARVQSLGETLDLLGVSPDTSERLIGDVLGMPRDDVSTAIARLRQIRQNAQEEMESVVDAGDEKDRISDLDDEDLLNEYAAYLSNKD